MRWLVWVAAAGLVGGCVSIPEWSFDEVEAVDANTAPPPPQPEMGTPPSDMGPGPRADGDVEPDLGCVRTDEVCNGRDDDCDRVVDEDFDFESDVTHCGGCGRACRPARATGVCVEGVCTVEACEEGFADLDDGILGCEYMCPTVVDDETCDGVDEDCDGSVDEGLDRSAPDQFGVCAAAMRVCNGADGWGPPDLEAVDDYQADEDLCDGLDNDCDGMVDEAQEALGELCEVGFGVCRQAGVRVCGPDRRSVTCGADPGMPTAADDSLCDGIDSDCDGRVDEDAAGCVRCAGPEVQEGLDPPCNGCPAGTAVAAGRVCVPAGSFDIGSPEGEVGRTAREGPQHRVRLSRAFVVDETEVTQRAWLRVFEDDPSFFDGNPRRPVEQVTWFEAAAYANALSEAEGREVCYALDGCNGAMPGDGVVCAEVEFAGVGCEGYRLPTEAEWEYAVRAGGDGRFWFGDDEGRLDMSDFFSVNGGGVTHDVGQLAPNPWGLYDVHGNVWEWVHDRYAAYQDQIDEDPVGPAEGDQRVRRGGSFGSLSPDARSAFREGLDPSTRLSRGGFRLVRTVR